MFFSPQILSRSAPRSSTGGGGGGSTASAFLARTSGLDSTHITAYTDLLNGLDTDGLTSKLDVLYIFATQDSTTALLNLVSSSFNGTSHGSPTFTADRGFTGSEGSSTVYIDTGFNPTTASSPKYTQDSAHQSIWNRNTTTTTNNACCGSATGSSNAYLFSKYSGDSSMYSRINCANNAGINASAGDAHGLEIGNRSNSSNVQQWLRGSNTVNSSASTSFAPPNLNFYVLAVNSNGTAGGCGLQYASYSVGSSLGSTDASNLTTRLQTWMTTVGA